MRTAFSPPLGHHVVSQGLGVLAVHHDERRTGLRVEFGLNGGFRYIQTLGKLREADIEFFQDFQRGGGSVLDGLFQHIEVGRRGGEVRLLPIKTQWQFRGLHFRGMSQQFFTRILPRLQQRLEGLGIPRCHLRPRFACCKCMKIHSIRLSQRRFFRYGFQRGSPNDPISVPYPFP